VAVLPWLFSAATASAAEPLAVAVDARDLPRHLLHADITVPCRPGVLKLWYPKWIPGTHAPWGRVENVGGLRIETADGRPLAWKRDEVEPCCVSCDVPAGVRAVRARLDYICNEVSMLAGGHLSDGSRSVGVINWNTCVLYPDGADCTTLPVRLRLRLPAGWRHATAIKSEGERDGEVAFRELPLADLIDSPLIAGEHLRTFKLDAGDGPPAFLHVASESPSALQLDAKVVDYVSRLVREAVALFGAAHYPEYHFLVTCSDDLGYFGLEHHACSLNGVRERDLVEDKDRRGWVANLLPHEYAHAWCGKFRRPAAMCTTDFHTPQRTKLLWVYEGLTTYLGDVLMVRCGLVGDREYREWLAEEIGGLMHREGRRWRSLEDTAVANHLLRAPSRHWGDLRRGQDFYQEGALLWLEVDAMLRANSNGRYSLDDFCKRFFGPIGDRGKVVPYDFPDIVKPLRELAPEHDWEQFLTRRVSLPLDHLPLDVVGRCGYRLQYAVKPSGHLEYLEEHNPRSKFISARDSLGLTFGEDGRIQNVIPGMAGDKGGLTSGVQVIGVNGRKFSRPRLRDALADSVTLRKVELLLQDGDRFRTVALDYADGPKYLELVRDPDKPDLLADILKPQAAQGPKGRPSPGGQ
jgi:predicted metalloprotease with PDZ domain